MRSRGQITQGQGRGGLAAVWAALLLCLWLGVWAAKGSPSFRHCSQLTRAARSTWGNAQAWGRIAHNHDSSCSGVRLDLPAWGNSEGPSRSSAPVGQTEASGTATSLFYISLRHPAWGPFPRAGGHSPCTCSPPQSLPRGASSAPSWAGTGFILSAAGSYGAFKPWHMGPNPLFTQFALASVGSPGGGGGRPVGTGVEVQVTGECGAVALERVVNNQFRDMFRRWSQ